MADHENLPAWTVGSRHPADRPKGHPAVGARYRVRWQTSRPVRRLMGYEITAFDRDRGLSGTMRSPMFGFSERHRFEPDAAGDSGFDERSGRPLRPEAMSWPKCPLPNSQVRARRTPFRLRGRTGQNSGVRNENLRVRKDFACNGQ